MEDTTLEFLPVEKGIGPTYSIVRYPGKKLPETYINFVLTNWVYSLKMRNEYFKLIDAAVYYPRYRSYAIEVLNRLNTDVRLAVLTDQPDVAMGFSVSEKDVLHYVFVHRHYRLMKLATNLLPPEVTTITHLTDRGISLWTAKFPKATFNPFQ